MNKIELQQLKEVSDLLKTLFKYSVYLDDILEKETIKNEKNIANANRYNKEKREENNKIDWSKYPEVKTALLKFKEQQESNKDAIDTTNDIDNIDNKLDDLD